MSEERTVLHVLPHPGGGGETYVDVLSDMDGYRFERIYLASCPDPRVVWRELPSGVLRAHRAARLHDIVHVAGEVAGALMLPALATRPSVFTTHGLHLLRRVQGPRRTAAMYALKAVASAASATICTSAVEYDEVRDLVPRTARRRLRVIHNGVGRPQSRGVDDRAAARARLGVQATDLVGAWVAGLDQHKDPLTPAYAAIAASVPHARVVLIVVGDGPMRATMGEVAKRSDGRVRVLGFRPDVAAVLAAADFFVVSSIREGLSFSLLEAMSAGLPIVATRTLANVEAAGEAALYVPVGDVEEFSTAFLRLATDSQMRTQLGDAARARVKSQFDVRTMIRQTQGVYASIFEARGGG